MATGAIRRTKPREPKSFDGETRARDDHHDSLRLWLRLLSCSALIENHIRQRLQGEFETTLPRFDLMAQLERCPEGLKMGELSKRLMVTGGNVTGITDLLEEEGLVARVIDAQDRRAFRVKLTPSGQRLFKRMAAAHERWIVNLFDALPAKSKQRLAGLLQDLKIHVRRQERPRAGNSI
ncbi:MAG TPA: MarR family transcriptional regulator [Steroidobacteraceae bacterium]|jgi:DNA-binding MarR family transcriptional regulator|nr:MarR family transcriptional regulator [Steroidobacteraceae bacterium]